MFFFPSSLSWEMGKGRKEKNHIKCVSSKMNCVSSQAGFQLSSFLFSEVSLTINPFLSPFVHENVFILCANTLSFGWSVSVPAP